MYYKDTIGFSIRIKMMGDVLTSRLYPFASRVTDELIRTHDVTSMSSMYCVSHGVREVVVDRLKQQEKGSEFWHHFIQRLIHSSRDFPDQFYYDFKEYFCWGKSSIYFYIHFKNLDFERFEQLVDWTVLTSVASLLYNDDFDFLYRYKDKIKWKDSVYLGCGLPENQIRMLDEYICFDHLTDYKSLSYNFLDDYADKINWDHVLNYYCKHMHPYQRTDLLNRYFEKFDHMFLYTLITHCRFRAHIPDRIKTDMWRIPELNRAWIDNYNTRCSFREPP